MTDKPPIRFAFNTHGLGDVCHAAQAMRLYIDRGYNVQIQVEPNKRWIWDTAGIPIYDGPDPLPIHPYYYLPSMDAFWNLSLPDHSSSKIAGFFDVDVLPNLGSKEQVWRELCEVQIDATRLVSDAALDDASLFLQRLPKPIVLLHSKGTNWQAEKSLPDATAFEFLRQMIDSFSGSIITLDWDRRSPTLGHERIRPICPYWSHLPLDVFAALCMQSDLLIGVDSGPFHLAQWLPIKTLFVTHKIPPVRCCLPNPRATYLVPASQHDHWATRSPEWNFAEFHGDAATVQDLVTKAYEMVTPATAPLATSRLVPDVPGRYLYRRVDHDERPMELLPDGKIGEGAAGCELSWKIERTPSGAVLTIYGHHGGATCHLSAHQDGVWRGRWLAHERMPIELIPQAEGVQQPSEVVVWSDLTPTTNVRPFAVGIPTLNRYDLLERCVAACWAGSVVPERLIIIDNGGKLPPGPDVIRPARNIGVAASWNMIHRVCQPLPLIILNDDIEPGHNLFERLLDSPEPFVTADESHMFEAFLIRQEAWQAVGEFDETFYPAYHEDNDYFMRLRLANVAIGCPQSDGFIENGPSATKAQFTAEQHNEFNAQFNAGRQYYVRKWGGAPHCETYTVPFNGQNPRA